MGEKKPGWFGRLLCRWNMHDWDMVFPKGPSSPGEALNYRIECSRCQTPKKDH